MGSGSSIQRISSDESAQPLLKQGGDGQGRASAESASLVGKAETLVKYGTCPDIPDIPDLEIPRMRISEDRVLQLGLPEDLDLKDRTRYERGLFRLCFPAGMFEECKDGEPPTFGTAIVPKKPILRELVEHAITFVDHVMHYIVDTCGIEPKRFLEAAARYGNVWEETRRPASIFEFLERDLSIGHAVTSIEQMDVASAFIEDVRSELENAVNALGRMGLGDFALPYCRSTSLYTLTDSISVFPSLTAEGNFRNLTSLHFTVASCCLKEYQAILSQSEEFSHLLLAAIAASTMHAVRHRLDPMDKELFKPDVEQLLSILTGVVASGDLEAVGKWAEVL